MPRAHSFFAALVFLTGLPMPTSWAGGEEDLGRSTVFFPLLGLGIGFFVAAVHWASNWLFGAPLLTGSLSVLAMISVSRALHLDGLSDTFDGFLSSRPPARILEIMKDSRVGAMGVLGIVGIVIVKWSAIVALPAEKTWQTLVLMPVAGRCALVFCMAMLPYARPEGGLATTFKRHCGAGHFFFSALFLFVAGWGLLGFSGLFAAAMSVALTIAFAWYCFRKIKGFTGDTLGAGAELIELTPALAVLIWGERCLTF